MLAIALLVSCTTSKTASREDDRPAEKALPAHSVVRVSYDAERRMTLVRLHPDKGAPAADRTQIVAGGAYPGKLPRAPSTVMFGVRSSGKTWRHEGCATLDLLADDAPAVSLPATRERQIGSGYLTEYLLAMIPYSQLRQLAGASLLRIKACGLQIRVSDADRRALRAFVEAFGS